MTLNHVWRDDQRLLAELQETSVVVVDLLHHPSIHPFNTLHSVCLSVWVEGKGGGKGGGGGGG